MGDPAKVIMLEATLKVIREENLLERVNKVGGRIMAAIQQLQVGFFRGVSIRAKLRGHES